MGYNGGGHHGNDGPEDFTWDLDVEYNFEVDVVLNFETNVDYDSDYGVDFDLDVDVDIEGNFAGFQVDVQALGEHTSTEVNLAVITLEDQYSSISMTGYSAVA